MSVQIECVVISGATAAALKTAFDLWNLSYTPFGNMQNKTIVSVVPFGVTDLIVFFYTKRGSEMY